MALIGITFILLVMVVSIVSVFVARGWRSGVGYLLDFLFYLFV